MRPAKLLLLLLIVCVFAVSLVPLSAQVTQPTPTAQLAPPAPLLTYVTRLTQATLGTSAPLSSWDFEAIRTRSSALDCPFVTTPTEWETEIVAYAFTLTFGSVTADVRSSADGSIIVYCNEQFLQTPTLTPTATPTGMLTATPTERPRCLIAPNGGITNVRSEPSTQGGNATILAQINFSTPAIGRTEDGTWYRLAHGWVAASVVTTAGECASLPVVEADSRARDALSTAAFSAALGTPTMTATQPTATPTPSG
jgi:hypothetical protein